MLRYLAGRTIQGIVTLLLVSLIVFGLSRSTGDPAQLMVPFTAGEEEVAAMRERLGTDRPVVEQYFIFLGDIARGDFGESIRLRIPVTKLIWDRLPASLALAILALGFALPISLILGTIAATHRGTFVDLVSRLTGLIGLSLPSFWIGIMLIEIFAVRLGLLPTSGSGGFDHMILPALTLSLFVMGGLMRLFRSGLIEALGSQYVLEAHARGLSRRRVVLKHALRNALIPVVSLVGVYFPLLVSSAVVVETVFAWPGVGRLAFQAIISRDFPVIQGVTMLGSVVVVVTSLIVDTAYAVIDPRIRDEA